jgi:hypothetical protein
LYYLPIVASDPNYALDVSTAARIHKRRRPKPARKMKVSVPPGYPEMARKLNEGMVRVLLIVNPAGKSLN